jgi:SAM-dependent methyltransferase
MKPIAAPHPRLHDARVASSPVFQHPLAFLLGVEGVALMRAFAGEHDEAFTRDRIAEVRALLDDVDRWGAGSTLHPLTPAEAYDGWAPSYDGPNTAFEYEEPAILPLLDALPPGVAVDAACGTGRHARHLAAHGHEVHGFDLSPGMLAVARQHLPDAHLEVADVAALPMPDSSADLVVNALALAHVEDLAPVFAEAARVLRPGGHLVVSDTRGLFLGSGRYPLVMETVDGRIGYLPTWRHGIGEYVRTALAHGFEIAALEQPERAPMDDGDWDPPELPAPGDPVDFWALMSFAPVATGAAYLGTAAVVVWDFRLR